MERCEPTAHDFEKFNESTVVCRKCAEQRTVTTLEAVMEQLKAVHICYIPCTLPHYPYQPDWTWRPQPYVWPATTWTSNGTSTTNIPNLTVNS